MLKKRKEWKDEQGRHVLIATYGLRQLKGNTRPYFSVTGETWINGREDSRGCIHDEIESAFPGELSDLIALHLSDDDGAPMYAEDNGWYWLAGCAGGLGQQYHGGNNEYLRETPLAIFAKHCRISEDEATRIVRDVVAELGPESEQGPSYTSADYKRARAKWQQICNGMRPRWKREADAAIEKHALVVEVE
jgi:hypothetical protein